MPGTIAQPPLPASRRPGARPQAPSPCTHTCTHTCLLGLVQQDGDYLRQLRAGYPWPTMSAHLATSEETAAWVTEFRLHLEREAASRRKAEQRTAAQMAAQRRELARRWAILAKSVASLGTVGVTLLSIIAAGQWQNLRAVGPATTLGVAAGLAVVVVGLQYAAYAGIGRVASRTSPDPEDLSRGPDAGDVFSKSAHSRTGDQPS